MTQFPMALAKLPDDIAFRHFEQLAVVGRRGLQGSGRHANGPAKEKQISTSATTTFREVPESFRNLKKIGLLDLAQNQIETIHPLGKEVAPVKLYFDNNKLTSLPADGNGLFCTMDGYRDLLGDLQQFTKFPNIFSPRASSPSGRSISPTTRSTASKARTAPSA